MKGTLGKRFFALLMAVMFTVGAMPMNIFAEDYVNEHAVLSVSTKADTAKTGEKLVVSIKAAVSDPNREADSLMRIYLDGDMENVNIIDLKRNRLFYETDYGEKVEMILKSDEDGRKYLEFNMPAGASMHIKLGFEVPNGISPETEIKVIPEIVSPEEGKTSAPVTLKWEAAFGWSNLTKTVDNSNITLTEGGRVPANGTLVYKYSAKSQNTGNKGAIWTKVIDVVDVTTLPEGFAFPENYKVEGGKIMTADGDTIWEMTGAAVKDIKVEGNVITTTARIENPNTDSEGILTNEFNPLANMKAVLNLTELELDAEKIDSESKVVNTVTDTFNPVVDVEPVILDAEAETAIIPYKTPDPEEDPDKDEDPELVRVSIGKIDATNTAAFMAGAKDLAANPGSIKNLDGYVDPTGMKLSFTVDGKTAYFKRTSGLNEWEFFGAGSAYKYATGATSEIDIKQVRYYGDPVIYLPAGVEFTIDELTAPKGYQVAENPTVVKVNYVNDNRGKSYTLEVNGELQSETPMEDLDGYAVNSSYGIVIEDYPAGYVDPSVREDGTLILRKFDGNTNTLLPMYDTEDSYIEYGNRWSNNVIEIMLNGDEDLTDSANYTITAAELGLDKPDEWGGFMCDFIIRTNSPEIRITGLSEGAIESLLWNCREITAPKGYDLPTDPSDGYGVPKGELSKDSKTGVNYLDFFDEPLLAYVSIGKIDVTQKDEFYAGLPGISGGGSIASLPGFVEPDGMSISVNVYGGDTAYFKQDKSNTNHYIFEGIGEKFNKDGNVSVLTFGPRDGWGNNPAVEIPTEIEFEFTEITAPNGYMVNQEPVRVILHAEIPEWYYWGGYQYKIEINGELQTDALTDRINGYYYYSVYGIIFEDEPLTRRIVLNKRDSIKRLEINMNQTPGSMVTYKLPFELNIPREKMYDAFDFSEKNVSVDKEKYELTDTVSTNAASLTISGLTEEQIEILNEKGIKEVGAPDGYKLQEEPSMPRYDLYEQAYVFDFYDEPAGPFRVLLRKQDSNGNAITTDTAEFQILDEDGNLLRFSKEDGGYYDIYTLDPNGEITRVATTTRYGRLMLSGMPEGKYYAREIVAPDGYAVLDADVEFEVTPVIPSEYNTLNIKNPVFEEINGSHASSAFKKIEELDNNANYGYGYLGDQNCITVSDKNKTVKYTLSVSNVSTSAFKDLVIIDRLPEKGDVGAINQKAKRGSAFSVGMADDPAIRVYMKDKNLNVHEVSVSNYSIEYSAKTSFTEGDFAGEANAERWNASASGAKSFRIVLKEDLPVGWSVFAEYNGKLSDEAKPGQTAWNSFGYRYITDGEMHRAEPPKVGVKVPSQIKLGKVDENGDYLYGAELSLTRYEQVNEDGTTKYVVDEDFEPVAWTTTRLGLGDDEWLSSLRDFNGLEPGRYKFEEVNAPNGYTCSEGVTFDLNDDGTVNIISDAEGCTVKTDADNIITINMIDTPVTVTLQKTDIGTIVDGAREYKNLTGAEFEVRAAEGKTFASGKSVINGVTADVKTNVLSKLTGEMVAGDVYIFKEIKAPAGYMIAPEFAVRVEKDGNFVLLSDREDVSVSDNNITLRDNPIEVHLYKTDEIGRPLENAVFEVTDEESGATVTIVSDENGKMVLKTDKFTVSAGRYYTVHEKQAPSGYKTCEDFRFTIEVDGTLKLDKEYKNVKLSNNSMGIIIRDEAIKESPVAPDTPITGDDTTFVMSLITMFAAIIGAIGAFIARRRPGEYQ